MTNIIIVKTSVNWQEFFGFMKAQSYEGHELYSNIVKEKTEIKIICWQNILHVGNHLGWEQMNRQPDRGILDLTACWNEIARSILMECWLPGIKKSRDLVFLRDLMRFHNSKVLCLFLLRFWAFWRKNRVNRTNIKEDRAILRFFQDGCHISAIFDWNFA